METREFNPSDQPKQCFTVLPKLNRMCQSKFCFPKRNQTEPNKWKAHKNLDQTVDLTNKQIFFYQYDSFIPILAFFW